MAEANGKRGSVVLTPHKGGAYNGFENLFPRS